MQFEWQWRRQQVLGVLSNARKGHQMRIRVTQQDIDEGVQSNCFNCPVARAIKRAFKAAEVLLAVDGEEAARLSGYGREVLFGRAASDQRGR
jgi:hypothetical protein